jgi:hypothetical protein
MSSAHAVHHGIESRRSRVRRDHAPTSYLMTIPSAAFSSGLPIQYSYLAAMRMRCWRSSAVGGFLGEPAFTGLPISRKNPPSLHDAELSTEVAAKDNEHLILKSHCRNTGVHHVGLHAKDPAASAAFYRDILGMKLVGGTGPENPIGATTFLSSRPDEESLSLLRPA